MEEAITKLTVDAPMVVRSVETRTAARIMIERFREATEMLAENVSHDTHPRAAVSSRLFSTVQSLTSEQRYFEGRFWLCQMDAPTLVHRLCPQGSRRI